MRTSIELPLVIYSHHVSKDVEQLHDAINQSIVNIEVSIEASNQPRLESYLADIKHDDFQASFIRYGVNTHVCCLQDNFYCLVIPYAGKHTIKHPKYNCTQNSKVSFIPPLTDIKMHYTADCGHLVLRFVKSPFNNEIFKHFYDSNLFLNPTMQSYLQRVCLNFINNSCYLNRFLDNEKNIFKLKQDIYDTILNLSRPCESAQPSIERLDICHLLDFIKANINWDYNIEDLTNLSNIPIRTLYWRFKKHTGITPYRYHLNCKLKCARLDLLKFGEKFTVTETATRYGFVHLSRFSSHYKALFGELPKQTMKRASKTQLR
jgi:AraC-like DNA-binding protein